MSALERIEVTDLLHAWQRGDRQAMEQLMEVVYDQLRRQAAAYLGRERRDHTLQPTALVHEAYVRLIEKDRISWQDRGHFFAMSARAMRRVLVDYARAHKAKKRGAGMPQVSFEDIQHSPTDSVTMGPADLLLLDESLKRLDQIDPQKSKIVQLRYFGGFSLDEITQMLGCSRATVTRHWRMAKAWLYRDMQAGQDA